MSKHIGVLCEQFYKMDGSDSLMGGGERYLVDFVDLLKRMGYDVSVFQFSTKPWSKRYKTMAIRGLGNIENEMFPTAYYSKGIKMFTEATEKCDGIFYLGMTLCFESAKKPLLTVSHGLMIDGVTPGAQHKVYDNLDAFKRWVKNCTQMISVDSNTVKLAQVYCHQMANKLTYIPNYVDLNKFSYEPKEDNGRFTVLYPRRLQWCRGYTTAMDAVEKLIAKYDDIDFVFCGKGNPDEENHFSEWMSGQPQDRVKWISHDMADMPRAFKNCDISITPTIMAEGTSLAVLESLASGVVPIVSCVGGLTDLVMGGFNGVVIKPDDTWEYHTTNSTYLVEGIERLYHNREEIEVMRQNGLNMIKAFDKKIWESKVSKVIKSVYGEPNE